MEIINIVSGILLLAVIAVGVILKRYTRRTLSDMDGMGEATTTHKSNIIAKF